MNLVRRSGKGSAGSGNRSQVKISTNLERKHSGVSRKNPISERAELVYGKEGNATKTNEGILDKIKVQRRKQEITLSRVGKSEK